MVKKVHKSDEKLTNFAILASLYTLVSLKKLGGTLINFSKKSSPDALITYPTLIRFSLLIIKYLLETLYHLVRPKSNCYFMLCLLILGAVRKLRYHIGVLSWSAK